LVFHQSLRQTEGLHGSPLQVLGLDLPVPDHTTLSRRSHEMAFARDVGNRVLFLHKGRTEEQGHPREVLANPQSDRLRAFLSNSLHSTAA